MLPLTAAADLLERWGLIPETYQYRNFHLVPTLTGLKPEHIQRYQSEKLSVGRCDGKGGLSPKTVRHHHVTLHDALEHAIKMGLLTRNVADAVNTPRCQRTQWQTLNELDISMILDAAKKTPFYTLFYVALFTGMRRSELLALRWLDLDLLLCRAYVTRSLHHLRTGEIVFRAPKSAKGHRMIPLPPSAALVLQEHRDKQEAQRGMLGIPVKDDDMVFADFKGNPLLPDTVTHAWIKLVRRTGFAGIRLHDARHTFASIHLKMGTHPKVVSEMLGHASVQITLDTYSHVVPGLQEAAAISFDKMVLQKREREAVGIH